MSEKRDRGVAEALDHKVPSQTPDHADSGTDGFETSVLQHQRELFAAAVRLTKSRHEAEDLVQEAIERAWGSWDRFERGNARAWAHRILVNTFINGYRRRRREYQMLAEASAEADRIRRRPVESDHVRARHDAIGDEVAHALAKLTPDYRAVVWLVDVEGRAYKDVARRLNCPIGTVMSRLHRARGLLKRTLRDYAISQGLVPQAA